MAKRLWSRLLVEYPEWENYFDTLKEGELEVAVPAPAGSKAGHLVVFTSNGDLWVRYSPPQMCYPVDNEEEMLSVIKQLLADQAAFVVITEDGEWAGTTLVKPGQEPPLEPGQVAQVVSWSGRHDDTISADAKRP